MSDLEVVLEVGQRWTFAVVPAWPGWARRGRGAETALSELERYRSRYVAAVPDGPRRGDLVVVGEIAGSTTTDFGAPAAVLAGDERPWTAPELLRQVGVLESLWAYFDQAVAGAPAELAKGPRGGGRDRDEVAEHVRDAERVYARKLGAPVAPRTPWTDQRAALREALASDVSGAWLARTGIRRVAWHLLDHAWEIEDRSGGKN